MLHASAGLPVAPARPVPGAMGTDLLLKRWCPTSQRFVLSGALRMAHVRCVLGQHTVTCPSGSDLRRAVLQAGPDARTYFGGACEVLSNHDLAVLEDSRAHRQPARWQIRTPGGGGIEGAFAITALSRGPAHTHDRTFFLELGSTGSLSAV